jgi:hypothetical protein
MEASVACRDNVYPSGFELLCDIMRYWIQLKLFYDLSMIFCLLGVSSGCVLSQTYFHLKFSKSLSS